MADAREVTATLVVNFGATSGENDGLFAEVDSRDDGLNGGKTSFNPGDEVYILLYMTDNVTLNEPVTSHGDLIFEAGMTPELVDKTDDLQFVDNTEATLSFPLADTGFTGQWLGNDLGTVNPVSQLKVNITQPVDEHWAGVYRINWTAEARVYRLTNTALSGVDSYPIVVHFTGIAS